MPKNIATHFRLGSDFSSLLRRSLQAVQGAVKITLLINWCEVNIDRPTHLLLV